MLRGNADVLCDTRRGFVVYGIYVLDEQTRSKEFVDNVRCEASLRRINPSYFIGGAGDQGSWSTSV